MIRGYDNGFSIYTDDAIVVVRDNLIENCPGMALHAHSSSTGTALFSGNTIRNCGTGIVVDYSVADVKDNSIQGSSSDGIRFNGLSGTISGNVVGHSGRHGIAIVPSYYEDPVDVRNNTSYDNAGSGYEVDGN